MRLLLKDTFNYYRTAFTYWSKFWPGFQALNSRVKFKPIVPFLFLFGPMLLALAALNPSAKQYGRIKAWRRWILVFTIWPLEFYLRRVKYGLTAPYDTGPMISKKFWETFFNELDYLTPKIIASAKDGKFEGLLEETSLFIKPDDGALGKGTYKFNWQPEKQVFVDAIEGTSKTKRELETYLAELSQDGREYVVQGTLESCKELSHFASHTVRLVTFKSYDGRIQLVNPCFHLSNGHITSHAGNGGVYFELDAENSCIGTKFLGHEMKDDPSGLVLPHIQKALEQVFEAHRILPPGILWAGWDVILTDEGPYFLEGNIPPGDLYHFQFYDRLTPTWDNFCWPELLKYLHEPKQEVKSQASPAVAAG